MQETLYKTILENRERVVTLWQAAALPQDHGIPSKAAPAEDVLRSKIVSLVDWLLSDDEPADVRLHLREICRIKAVLALSPSQALGFILDLKGIIRLVSVETGMLDVLDNRIDRLMLLAFDEYSDCREQIMQIKIDEVQRLAGRYAR